MGLTIALCGAWLFAPDARADAWNKKTIVDFPNPVEVPGAVLEPGKYVLKLADSPSNRHIVQILNEREDHVYTTALAIPNYRMEASGKTIVTFYEMPKGQPEALHAWFYPGDNYGQEFAYPKPRATEIAQVTQQNVPTVPSDAEAKVTDEEKPTEEPSATNTEPQSSDAAAAPANPEQSPAQEQQPASSSSSEKKMPQTASNVPLVALIGILSIAGALATRVFSRRLG